MINIEEHTFAAGAYVLYKGYFLFMCGPGKNHAANELGVVRFGGHRENNESAPQCTAREVKEEASLDIAFFDNAVTYLVDGDICNFEKLHLDLAQNPVLAIRDKRGALSVVYLAYGVGELKPAMETQGILLLRREDVAALCAGEITLGGYRARGGKLLLARPLPDGAVLVPHLQLRFLDLLFAMEPTLMRDYINEAPEGAQGSRS